MKVIRFVGLADGRPWPFDGCYLRSVDPSIGIMGTFTRDLDKAMRFETARDALTVYRMQSQIIPYRDDGKPNRPLTSATVEILDVPN